ncbi:TraX protein [Anaerosphaera aminiphila DSM 21120]|uniref:TraX protein n=1 Tax=Anaerosphaera aminiphila DSM 21120 TaxID=1120995 RepID=A0A1M5QC17_9FIRM|nr:TraX family protein [Anaerosphaera aminiphila]SHH11309.1 TraX protein [Anaerosphaera aminiphila DSM 21120]
MTATSLKFLMMFLMVLDHIDYFIPIEFASLFHLISRPVAAVFAYFIVEGFIHTKSVRAYAFRLYFFGFAMSMGSFFINEYIIIKPEYFVNNSILLTFALGLTGLYTLNKLYYEKNKKLLAIILLLLIYSASLLFEGGITIFPFMIICYIYKNNSRKRNLIFVLITFLFSPGLFQGNSLREILINFGLHSDLLFFIAGLPFIRLYNGKRGLNNNFTKYIFYIFYPAHLWIIGIIASRVL